MNGYPDEAESFSASETSDSEDASVSEHGVRHSTDADPFADDEELREKITHLERQLLDVKNRLNRTKTELALEQSRRPTKYNDNYFQEQVDTLRYQIRQWTRSYFGTGKGHSTQQAKRKFKNVSRYWAVYMEDTGLRPRLIQARIWHTLLQRLFNPQSSKWRGWLYAGLKDRTSIDEILDHSKEGLLRC